MIHCWIVVVAVEAVAAIVAAAAAELVAAVVGVDSTAEIVAFLIVAEPAF